MQRKSLSTCSENVFNAGKAAIFPHSIGWIRNFILPLNETITWTHQKYFTFFLRGDVQLVQRYNRSPKNSYLSISLLPMDRPAQL